MTSGTPDQGSSELATKLLDCVADAIVVLDADMRLLYANAATRTIMTGFADGAMGASALDYIHPEDLAYVGEAFAELLRNPGTDESVQFRVLSANGPLPVEATATNLTVDADVGGVVVCFRDLSGEQAFRAQADMLLSAVEAATDVIVLLDPTGRVLHANTAARQLFGDAQPTHVDLIQSPSARMLVRDVGVPMARRTGSWTGEVTLAVPEDDLTIELSVAITAIRDGHHAVRTLSLIARDMTEHKLIEATLRHQARVDTLTGLLNRGGLMHELDSMLARCAHDDSVGVLFVDLDHFKIANDSIGHTHGDDLLRQVSERLASACYPSALARYGGDEFVVLIPRVRRTTDLLSLADGLCRSLAEPFTVAGNTVHMTCSVGVAVAHHDSAPDDVLRAADLAMYRAKERGRNRWALFDPSLHEAANRRLLLQAQLHRAVATGELGVRYQPIVELDTARITGFEALVRWHHPGGRLLLPDEFLDVARHAQLMSVIDDWVLAEACAQLGEWQRAHPVLAGELTMAVNLSAEQLARPELASVVADQLDRARVAPCQLVLEITEHQLLDGIDTTSARVAELRALGVGISLDDFGTDHSSLSYLSRLPIDVLKMDRAFLADAANPAGATVVRAVAALARELGVECVAEGVETEEQVALLRTVGVQRAQGFWYWPALDAAEAAELIGRQVITAV